nr:hypothetical protein [Tanacetum cinerariifolium]
MKKAFQDMSHEMGEANPTHAYYNGFKTSKDNEDPSWNLECKVFPNQFRNPEFFMVNADGLHTCCDACGVDLYNQDQRGRDFSRDSECFVAGRVLDDIDDNLKILFLLLEPTFHHEQ